MQDYVSTISNITGIPVEKLNSVDAKLLLRNPNLLNLTAEQTTKLRQLHDLICCHTELFSSKSLHGKTLKNADDVTLYFKAMYSGLEEQEILVCVFLDSKNVVLKTEELSRGTLHCTFVPIPLLLRHALLYGASAILLAHNHCGLNLEVSSQDIEITDLISNACKSIEIALLDHVIIGVDGYISMKERNLYE